MCASPAYGNNGTNGFDQFVKDNSNLASRFKNLCDGTSYCYSGRFRITVIKKQI